MDVFITSKIDDLFWILLQTGMVIIVMNSFVFCLSWLSRKAIHNNQTFVQNAKHWNWIQNMDTAIIALDPENIYIKSSEELSKSK